jgi:hypothetical protein
LDAHGERLLLCDAKVCSYDVGGDNGSYGSLCSSKVSTLVEDMESGANALHGFGALFLLDVRLGQDHGDTTLNSLEPGMMPFLEEDIVIVSLMFHGGLGVGVGVDTRVEDLGIEDSNPRMNM